MIRGQLHPGHAQRAQLLRRLGPSSVENAHQYLKVRAQLCDACGSLPVYGPAETQADSAGGPLLPQPRLLRPFNRISSVYERLLRHELRLVHRQFMQLLAPDEGAPNRFTVLAFYDELLAYTKECQQELLDRLGPDYDEQEPEGWFSEMERTSADKLAAFVFYNMRNLLLSLLKQANTHWPGDFTDEPSYDTETLFYEVLDAALPAYEVFQAPPPSPCTRPHCDHSLVHFEDAMIELGLRAKDQRGKVRHDKLLDKLRQAELHYVDEGKGKRFLRRCDLKTLKEQQLQKPA
ncbi:MAG: hypothetical protein ACOC2C_06920 [Cyclonatronaceae bacterium]